MHDIKIAATRWRHRPLLLVVLLILLSSALWLPNRPWIEDGLLQAPAAGFSVHTPFLRVLFEPFLGPLLFFSRADEPLQLCLWLVAWLAISFLLFQVMKARRQGASSWLASLGCGIRRAAPWLPVILVCFMALLLIFLFSPFPSDTLEHQEEDVVLVNLHSHTHNSHDGLISPLRLMHWHQRNGFDAFFIAEHNHHRATLELIQAQKTGVMPSEPLILAGQEYSGSNHLLLLGLTRDFNSKDYPDKAAIDSAHAQGGIALLAHWFSPHKNTRPLRQYIEMGIDGFEIANQAEGIFYPARFMRELRAAAESNQLLLAGNVDYHGYGPACFVWNALRIPNWRQMDRAGREQTILDVLRYRDQSRLQVLLYRDRMPIPAGLDWLSPAITLFDYFRSLSYSQIAAWMAWLALLPLIFRNAPAIPDRLRLSPQPREFMAIAGAAAAAITLLFGLWMLAQIPLLSEENKIFLQDGAWLSAIGILLFFYCLALLNKLKKMQLF